MKASDYIAEFLVENGVATVWEMTGGMITHLLDSLGARSDIRVVSAHHEQAAAFAAEGEARITGVPGVAMATSGPGATNLLTGIGSCYFDSVPAVFITGQVNTDELRGDSGVRQAGFQETDIVALASPITKASWRVSSASELPGLLQEAFTTALSGRPGPVLLDIPMDVQRAHICAPTTAVRPHRIESARGISLVLSLLESAERPLILAGGGVRAAGAQRELQLFAEATGIPTVYSLMGVDVLPYTHPLRVGLIGTYGNRWANTALGQSDCVLALGSRLDVRQTGADVGTFRRNMTLIRVDTDEDQLNWRVPADVAVVQDVRSFLAQSLAAATGMDWPGRDAWVRRIDDWRAEWPDAAETAGASQINPADVLHCLSDTAAAASAFVTDVGQNQMWAAQSLRLNVGQRFITSGGMGAMGFGLPAAMGVAVACPGRPVVVISGDGGMQVNIQELETIARLQLPIKIVVLNNKCLGMVRQFQDENLSSRYHSTLWGYGTPDFVAVSNAYGIPARSISSPTALGADLDWLMSEDGPALVEVPIDPTSCVRPKVAFGNAVFAMDDPPA